MSSSPTNAILKSAACPLCLASTQSGTSPCLACRILETRGTLPTTLVIDAYVITIDGKPDYQTVYETHTGAVHAAIRHAEANRGSRAMATPTKVMIVGNSVLPLVDAVHSSFFVPAGTTYVSPWSPK